MLTVWTTFSCKEEILTSFLSERVQFFSKLLWTCLFALKINDAKLTRLSFFEMNLNNHREILFLRSRAGVLNPLKDS